MRKIVLFFLLIYSNTWGQSLNDLEIKNGFRQFKLGSHPSQIKNIVRIYDRSYNFLNNPNVKIYRYTGNDAKKVHNVDIKNIDLIFLYDKLVSIDISFPHNNFTEEQFDNIKSFLVGAYGNNYDIVHNDKDCVNNASWESKSVELYLCRMYYKNVETGFISIYNKKMYHQLHMSEF